MLGIVKEFQGSIICNTTWIFLVLTSCLTCITKVLSPAAMVTVFYWQDILIILFSGGVYHRVYVLWFSETVPEEDKEEQ